MEHRLKPSRQEEGPRRKWAAVEQLQIIGQKECRKSRDQVGEDQDGKERLFEILFLKATLMETPQFRIFQRHSKTLQITPGITTEKHCTLISRALRISNADRG